MDEQVTVGVDVLRGLLMNIEDCDFFFAVRRIKSLLPEFTCTDFERVIGRIESEALEWNPDCEVTLRDDRKEVYVTLEGDIFSAIQATDMGQDVTVLLDTAYYQEHLDTLHDWRNAAKERLACTIDAEASFDDGEDERGRGRAIEVSGLSYLLAAEFIERVFYLLF